MRLVDRWRASERIFGDPCTRSHRRTLKNPDAARARSGRRVVVGSNRNLQVLALDMEFRRIGLRKSRMVLIVLFSWNLAGVSVTATTRMLAISDVWDTGLGAAREAARWRATIVLYGAQVTNGMTTTSIITLVEIQCAGVTMDAPTTLRGAAAVMVARFENWKLEPQVQNSRSPDTLGKSHVSK